MVYLCFVWAGKDVANSESAGKILVPRACNRPSLKKKWNAKLGFCFLMGDKMLVWHETMPYSMLNT